MTTSSAIRIADLIGTMGIDTHINYTDGGYSNLAASLKALEYLGISQVRDAAPNPTFDSYGQSNLGKAADAGLTFVLAVQGNVDPVVSVQRIHDFIIKHPGSVIGIEGPNEVNNWPVSYSGLSGTAAAQAYQAKLFALVNADPLLKNIPVLGFTDYPVHASASDLNNIHPYAKQGDQPRAAIIANIAAQDKVDPGKALIITETGYHTSLTADTNGGWEGVDDATQAKLLLNTFMDGAQLGATTTYIYQLLDAYKDVSGSNQEKHFGLFNLDYSPKAAATAIHNLTTILSDKTKAAETFSAGSLDYSVKGMPRDGYTMLTQKSDGSFQIIAWAEPDIWDEKLDRAITVASTSVTVDLGRLYETVKVYDPLLGTSAVTTYHNVSSVVIGITDHPLIVDVSGSVTPIELPVVTVPVIVDPAPNTTPVVTAPAVDVPVVTPPVVAVPVVIAPVLTAPVITAPVVAVPAAVAGLVLNGTAGNDSLFGGAGADTFHAGAGNDILWIDAKDILIDGGEGRDIVYVTGTGGVTLKLAIASIEEAHGGSGNDVFDGSASTVNLKLFGEAGDDILSGGSGIDEIYGGAGKDTFHGGAGNDIFWIDADDSLIDGGSGTDTVYVTDNRGVVLNLTTSSIEIATGGGGNDVFDGRGSTANLKLLGAAGNDILFGGNGNDELYGGPGADQFHGGAGNDVLWIDADDTLVDGGEGRDSIYVSDTRGVSLKLAASSIEEAHGGAGNDLFDGRGSTSNLKLYGGAGDDVLYAGSGRDELYGGDGKDVLHIGPGRDILTGGSGADIFVFDNGPSASNVAKITDFTHGVDAIWLNAALFAKVGAAGSLSADAFHASATGLAHDASDRIIYNQKTGDVSYDDDGNGRDAAIVFANIGAGNGLTASDFHLF